MIVVICADCNEEQHRIGNGRRDDYTARLPYAIAKCPHKVTATRDRDHQLDMQHMKELSSV